MIEAVVVNHNTSLFTLLALHSLHHLQPDHAGLLRLTVVDNASDDDDAGSLKRYCQERGIEFAQSGFGPGGRINSHGDLLRRYVLDHPAPDFYLFLDADVCFLEPDSVTRMRQELAAAAEEVWALQARFHSTERHFGADRSLATESHRRMLHLLAIRTEKPMAGEELAAMQLEGRRTHSGPTHARCHPACALIRNTPLFRSVAEHVGFSTAWIWSEDHDVGGFYDTLSLASRVMTACGSRVELSSVEVDHFYNVSYDERELTEKKRSEARRRLQRLETGRPPVEPGGGWGS
ncbi:MAG TPA: glycosyltransferase family A protein [Actinomycetota bacterium]|nr:glycosyltransferase family A protein [Actinomycetota bacterium]